MKYIKGYLDRVNESNSDATEVDDINLLHSLGLIDDSEKKKELYKLRTNSLILNSDEIQTILKSEQGKKFLEFGLRIVSTPAQLKNGTFIWAHEGYDKVDNNALGFFKSTNSIRRITKYARKRPGLQPSKPLDSMIIKIPQEYSGNSFYLVGMQWALDHLNLEGDSFSSKVRTKKGYFNQ
jgi:hypothetical protein